MQNTKPKTAQKYHLPPEWARQDALWTAWPSHTDEGRWPPGVMEKARAEIAQMIREASAGQTVNIIAMGEEPVQSARETLKDTATIIPAKFGDLWLRDTGPIFAFDETGTLISLRFKTNGWGGKYIYEFDDIIGDRIAEIAKTPIRRHDFVLEGGSIEHDGEGLLMTTRECILNPNRNPGWDQETAEKHLKAAFGAHRIIWLDDGMLNDHTDGHIDNIARFIAPNHVVCQSPSGKDDPNTDVFKNIHKTLKNAGLEVIQIPSPGLYKDESGDIVPASHMNFIITNAAVVVPVYGTASQEDALTALQHLFPHRKVVGVSSKAVLTGGGSFHCITQQQPAKED
jgi:agmatine deiminase